MDTAAYPVVTICGSMRFFPAMVVAAQQLTHEGFIVLMPFDTKEDQSLRSETNTMLDDMHKRKILMSGAIIVVTNHEYYVGESTTSEYRFACDHNLYFKTVTCDDIFDGTYPWKDQLAGVGAQ